MAPKYGMRSIIGIIFTLMFLMVGLFLQGNTENPPEGFISGLFRYSTRGNIVNSGFGGTPFFLFAVLALVYTIYNVNEWRIQLQRNQVDSSYHPLQVGSREYIEEDNLE